METAWTRSRSNKQSTQASKRKGRHDGPVLKKRPTDHFAQFAIQVAAGKSLMQGIEKTANGVNEPREIRPPNRIITPDSGEFRITEISEEKLLRRLGEKP